MAEKPEAIKWRTSRLADSLVLCQAGWKHSKKNSHDLPLAHCLDARVCEPTGGDEARGNAVGRRTIEPASLHSHHKAHEYKEKLQAGAIKTGGAERLGDVANVLVAAARQRPQLGATKCLMKSNLSNESSTATLERSSISARDILNLIAHKRRPGARLIGTTAADFLCPRRCASTHAYTCSRPGLSLSLVCLTCELWTLLNAENWAVFLLLLIENQVAALGVHRKLT